VPRVPAALHCSHTIAKPPTQLLSNYWPRRATFVTTRHKARCKCVADVETAMLPRCSVKYPLRHVTRRRPTRRAAGSIRRNHYRAIKRRRCVALTLSRVITARTLVLKTPCNMAVTDRRLRPQFAVAYIISWWRGTVVERRSLTGELSLSCARPAADG